MINYQFFPRSHGLTKEMEQIVDCFKAVDVAKKPEEQFSSNHMLSLVRAEKVLINKRNVENYQVFHYEA